MSGPAFTYWTLDPPARWQAGAVGKDRTPIYFSCADCGAKEPEIAGIISTDGTFKGIGLSKTESGFYNPAMFCAPCLAKRLPPAARVYRADPGQPGELDSDSTAEDIHNAETVAPKIPKERRA